MVDAFEDEVEPSVTIDEFLDNFEEEELEADLVLGGDEGNECTYGMGYMKRQAIFSCLTCTPEGNAGVCTACSLSCHDGHEIVELWTKRNFRCDCGNSKFGEIFCKLYPNKDESNVDNAYNQNFKGVYCTCARPYPDPGVEDQEEMVQCAICEDWFHEEHLGLESSDEVPRDEEGEPTYEDFMCKKCSAVCSFLKFYPLRIWATAGQSSDAVIDTTGDKAVVVACHTSGSPHMAEMNCELGKVLYERDAESSSLENKHVGESSGIKIEMEGLIVNTASDNLGCILTADAEESMSDSYNKPLFLSKGWRDCLCRCSKCIDMYNNKRISYLLHKEDSIAEYEKMAKKKREEKLKQQQGAELNFLDNLGHVEKLEVLNGIADFKEEFRSFLETFDSSKAVTSSDVHKIFENLAKKRQRLH